MSLRFPATITKLVHSLVFMSCLSLVESPEIQAVIGNDVILPCHTVFDKNNSKVTWKHSGQIVHTYQYGKDYLTNQHTNFKNRTSLFHDEMTRGNLSLKLTNVTERDAGSYSCEVPEQSKHLITLVVEIQAVIGDDVILPCHTVFDKNNSKVTWKHSGQIVHTYQYGKDYLTNQDTNFKNRTSLFHDEMTRGNLSLKLTNVTERDAGSYSCEVPEHPGHNITLVVERKPTKGPVHVTKEIIQAVIGDDVILPCHTVFDKNNSKVTWKHRDQIVHTYQYGKDCLTNQDTNFKNRTSLFHDEMTRGNLSLKLTNVTERDAGNYSCEVPEHPEHNITLVVERKPTKGPVHVTILYIGLSLGGLFIGALIGIVWKKYGNTSRCAGRDRRERNRAGIRESFPMRINMENPNDAAS